MPATRTKVLATLATVEQAKQDLEQALGKDLGNALLQELLISTYQDEMRVLTDARYASDPGMNSLRKRRPDHLRNPGFRTKRQQPILRFAM